ncbi:GNAT family N-acetyltransferase [Actinokineospora enzanensis]|uniref:GNAT family N-acetyltransferase n=1 Tax=Actinokineospora enzanensis TaxID=155975 RepID=UPI001FDFF6E7|nr:GNAT family N-acetyltransferase [Actinokineospora enzanensis]
MLVTPAHPTGTFRALDRPTLRVGDLVLRPWRPGDADAVLTAFRDPAIQRWHVRRFDDPAEALAWIDSWTGRWAAEEAGSWAVVDPDDQVLGQVGLREIDLVDASAMVSYWTLPAARGKAVAARATLTLVEWAFEVGFHRVNLEHSTANRQSCRVAEKAGFIAEGTRRGSIRHADGWHDMHLHARLRTDPGPGESTA